MPLVEVTLTQGREPHQLRELMHQVHEAVRTSIGANPQSIRVIVREVPRTLWSAGDQTLAERDLAQQDRAQQDQAGRGEPGPAAPNQEGTQP